MKTCAGITVTSASSLEELLLNCPDNGVIFENLVQAWNVINNPRYKKIMCSISGGSDSDVMMDVVFRCDKDRKVDYVWIDTGLEYQATKRHLNYMEKKYGVGIKRQKAFKPIPVSCREYGQPFLNKMVSEYIYRLQKHGFQWEDEPFQQLIKKYPRCKSALEWWCNEKGYMKGGQPSKFNIGNNRMLKEFMVKNPPKFKVSGKCCVYGKSNVAHMILEDGGYDLSVVGVRKAEGGSRAAVYKSSYDRVNDGCDSFRPLFFYRNEDKEEYTRVYAVKNSSCYSKYGLKRTGCAGCPMGRDFEKELEIIMQFEPELYAAVLKAFGDSYEYTRQYKQFREKMKSVA